MKVNKNTIKKIIREEYSKLILEEEERQVFQADELGFPIPPKLLKLLDPDITPQKFAALDAELDAKGTIQHQAFASLAFAMTYADNDTETATKILKLAIQLMPKIKKAMEKAKEKNKEE